MEGLVILPAQRTVFFVSDRTGITAEMLGNSLLSQFEGLNFQRRTIPFVDTPEKIDDVLQRSARGRDRARGLCSSRWFVACWNGASP